ncbi:Alpha/beta hydrolase family-domain-containing protein [Mycena latifolia]|nr:Alpha/beta hydrolase family-domain-containing protein [Mycena latifolia]
MLLCLSSIGVASGQSCGCSSIVIPVHVDVLISKDPADPFGGLKSNASSLRRLDDTYDVFGVFCHPNTVSPKNADVIQLLVHGFTYTNQYWSPPTEEFRNNSYSEFACDRGLSSLAIDWVGVGLSSRPANASDVQYATGAAVLSQLARHLKTASIFPGIQPFKKIIGIGHSAGSIMLNFGAIVESARSPFDGLILTSLLNVDLSTLAPLLGVTSARDDTPLRWGALDPNYVTTSNRSIFYPTDPTAFSPRMVIFDDFTKDVGSVSTVLQGSITSVTANYTGPVAKVVGSADDVAALTAAERMLWPEAQSFEVVVAQGSGHDMNLDFFAKGPFNTFVGLVNQFTAL